MSIETVLSFVLTLFVFSYLLGDNLLYRLATALLVGVASAFTAIVIVESVVLPLLNGDVLNAILLGISAVLVGLLLLKPLPLFTPFSNLAFSFLIAVGTAVALLGAISGTILPFISNTAFERGDNLPNAVIIFVGVVSSLMYFQYLARNTTNANGENVVKRGRFTGIISSVGEIFIAITLGAIYGGALLSSLTVLTGHLSRLLGS